MKKKRWSHGAIFLLLAIMLMIPAMMNGRSLSVCGIAPVSAKAEVEEDRPANEADGSKIDSVIIEWLTKDSTVDNDGKPVPADNDEDHLYLATMDDAELVLRFQFEISLSGQHDYEPGTIQISFPAQILHGREFVTGADGKEVCQVGGLLGNIDLSVPAAPSTMSDFNWMRIKDRYVLTNTRTIGAASKAMFQASITGMRPHEVVDMWRSEPLAVTCNVITNQGNMLTLQSESLTAQVDTHAKVTAAHKATNDDLYEVRPEELPAKLLKNLPQNADPDDYIYVRWYSYVYHQGNQPFTLTISDSLPAAYEKVTDENGQENKRLVTKGIFLGCTNCDGRFLQNGELYQADVFKNDYHKDTTESMDHVVYMWSAYKKDDFRVPSVSEPQVTYVMENKAKWSLTPCDAQIWQEDKTSEVSCSSSITYMPVGWSHPNGYFDVDKYTGSGMSRDLNYGYALNRLTDGEDVAISFRLSTIGFGYLWTAENNQTDPEDELTQEDFGKLGWKQVTKDYQTFFNANNTPLTYEDYEIDSLRIAAPQRYVYAKAKRPTIGFFDNGGGVSYGTIPAGKWGYILDSTLPVPDLHIEYMLEDDGVWCHAATANWGEDGKGALSFLNVGEGVRCNGTTLRFPKNTTDVRHTFTSNVFGGNTAEKCDIAGLIWDVYPSVTLKASDRIVSIADDLFAASDTPSTKFKNDAMMDAYGWVPAGGEGVVVVGGAYDISRATLSGASYGVTMKKEVKFDSRSTDLGGDSDVNKRSITLHYSATVYEQSNLTSWKDYVDAREAKVIPKETEGVWYDLLPPGVVPLMDTIRLREEDTVTNAYAIANYKDSGRTLLVVEAKMTPVPVRRYRGYADELTLAFDATYTWEDIDALGDQLDNYIAFESKAKDLHYNTLGSIRGEMGAPDDPRSSTNVTTPRMPDDVAQLMTDLDPATDESRFVYAAVKLNVSINKAAVSGISKTVANALDGMYTLGIPGQDQVSVYEGQAYTYRLRVISTENTRTKDIIIYDSIENYQIPDNDVSKQEDWNDQQGKLGWQGDWAQSGQWRGTLEKVDLGEFVQLGAAPDLYYSVMPGLEFKDAGSGLTQNGSLEMFSEGTYDLTDSGIWRKAELTADGIWLVPENVKGLVSAVAVDARRNTDGGEFVLDAGLMAAAYLHMTAPSDHGDENAWHAKGAYAHMTDENGEVDIDWKKALDPANNMYAYNNVRLKCVVSGVESSEVSTSMMIRNDYTRVGIVPGIFQVKKTWQDQNDHDKLRPEELTVTLMRRKLDTADQFAPVKDAQGNNMTVVLNEENDWTALFTQVDMQDENGTPYLYTFSEDELPGYMLTVKRLDETHYELINRHPNETIELTGKKVWDDDDDALGLRPESVTINLYRDGKYFKRTTAQPDENGDWAYSFGNLERFEDGGREYVYTIEESYVPKYASQSADWNLLTNRLDPYGDLAVVKRIEGATAAASTTEFTFTLTLLAEQTDNQQAPVPLMQEFDYEIFEAEGESWKSIGTGKITSGGTFRLKDNQKIIVRRLPSETTYRIEEGRAAGFTLTSKVNDSGAIRAGRTVQAEFTNTYQTKGTVQLAAQKRITGQLMRANAFRFELWDVTNRDEPVLKNTAYSGAASSERETEGGPITSMSDVYFGQLEYSAEDDGMTYTYEIREVNDQRSGYTYDNRVYTVNVTVTDNGNGTMQVDAVSAVKGEENSGYKDATIPGNMPFCNIYTAEGEIVMRAWKRLLKRELMADEFTFELYPFDAQSNKITGAAIQTKKNDEQGNIVFDPISFDQDDLSADFRNPAVYSYLMREVPGSDPTVIYDYRTVYLLHFTVYDGYNGELSFSQTTQMATLTVDENTDLAGVFTPGSVLALTVQEGEAAPVFTNDLKNGALAVSKYVTGTNPNPEQSFRFYVRFTGENLPKDFKYTVGGSSSSSSSGQTSGYFHATYEQLMGVAYAVLDKTTGEMTFFRSEDQKDHLGRAFDMQDKERLVEDNLIYYRVDEENEPEFKLEDERWDDTRIYLWPWYEDREKIRHVTMKGAIKPAYTAGYFRSANNMETADLSLLDTSDCVRMDHMFNGCGSLKELDVSHFDTKNVKHMEHMFNGLQVNELDASSLDMSSVEHTNGMFKSVTSRRIIFPKSEAPNLKTCQAMFQECKTEYVDFSDFSFAGMEDMGYLFEFSEVKMIRFPTGGSPNLKAVMKVCSGSTELVAVDMSGITIPKEATWTDVAGMFMECPNLASLDMSSLDTSNIDFSGNKYDYLFKNTNIYELTIGDKTIIPADALGIKSDVKWKKADGTEVTTEELFRGNHAGTWVRADALTYTMTFDAGEGSGLAPNKQWAVDRACAFKVPSFTKPGYVLTGFKDQEGNFYPVNGDMVLVEADTAVAGETLELTAQWKEAELSAKLEEGVVTFELMDGETAVFADLPASIAYEVWEETPAGWSLVERHNDSGVIQPNKTSKASLTNSWTPGEVSVQLRASKMMDGAAAESGAFTFGLVHSDRVIQTVTNQAGGAVVFDKLTFGTADVDKTYEYTIREKDAEDATVSYDTRFYQATIEIARETVGNQDVLKATVTYKDAEDNELDGPPVFENTTKPGSLKLTKEISGETNAAKNQEFTIEVLFTDQNRDPWTGDKNGNVTVNGDPVALTQGKATVQVTGRNTLTFTDLPAGTRYEAKETGSLPGWTMDGTVHAGQIAANAESEHTFTNSYSAKGTAVIEVRKNLVGRTPEDGEFTFALYKGDKAEGEPLDTAVNMLTRVQTNPEATPGEAVKVEEVHLARFDEIAYVTEGTHTYLICEQKGSDSTVDYSKTPIKVTVDVRDEDGKGRLTATVTYEGGSNVITNTVLTGKLSLSKTVENAKPMHTGKEFEFTLYLTDAKGQPLSGEYTLSDGGTLPVSGGAGSLKLADGETVTISGLPDGAKYTLVEETASGFSPVSSGAAGTIAAAETAEASFTNTYQAEGSYVFAAHKSLQGAELKADQFTFEVRGAEGKTVLTAKNAADGSVTFAPLYFTDGDVGEKTYSIREIGGSEDGYTYDKTVYDVKLTIGDNGDGTLSVTPDTEPESVVFVNTYSAYMDVSATKVWRGGEELARPDIILRLYSQVNQDEKVLVGEEILYAHGDTLTVVWEDMPVFAEDGRTAITYSVEEEILLEEGEENPYLTVITGSASEGFTVINRYAAAKALVEANKTLIAGDLEAGQFLFRLSRDGEVVSEASNAADGSITFPELMYRTELLRDVPAADDGSRTLVLTYTLAEAPGENARYIYDETVYTVQVTLRQALDGTLSAQTLITDSSGEEAAAEFINEAKTTGFVVTKSWQGGGGGPIELTLYADGQALDPQPAYTRRDDVYMYADLPAYTAEGEWIEYSAKERYVEGFVTIYDNIAPYEDETKRVYDGGTIINRVEPTPSLVVTKKWIGLDDGKKKPEITLTLYCNGIATDVKTPRPDSAGRYKYYDLPAFVDGEPAVYTVKEEVPAGYLVQYVTANGATADCARNGDTIINTRIPLPETGDGDGLGKWLALAGVSMLLALCLGRKKKPA